jgi:hypothetical protein
LPKHACWKRLSCANCDARFYRPNHSDGPGSQESNSGPTNQFFSLSETILITLSADCHSNIRQTTRFYNAPELSNPLCSISSLSSFCNFGMDLLIIL